MAETSVPPVVTPRRTTLVRAGGLRAFQRAIVERACADGTIAEVRSRCVVVPTRAAGAALARTIEDLTLAAADAPRLATALPRIVTRRELYEVLHQHLGPAPRLLTDVEREALLRRSAREVEAAGVVPPFRIRPGLMAEVLRFYDALRRRGRSVDAFERLMTESLEPSAEYDRGAERLLRQTRFLAAAYRAFESALAATGAVDEHGLRRRLVETPAAQPITQVIVAVLDDAADTGGLWPSDFDLLARLPGLDRLDIVATEEQVSAGFHERIAALLPGIVEERTTEDSAPAPVLLAPPGPDTPLVFTARDREEELVEVVRLLKSRRRRPTRFGVVFQRPLPYLYLARQVLTSGRVPFQATDALPLAAEPFAAAVDAVLTCLVAEYTRGSLIELLRRPQFGFDPARRGFGSGDVAAFNRFLIEAKYLGGRDALARLEDHPNLKTTARPLLAASLQLAERLEEVRNASRASAQLELLLAFLRDHERIDASGAGTDQGRNERARAAVLSTLEQLRDAHAAYDDEPVTSSEVRASIHRWIEAQTFAPRTGREGIHLVDADAARFGAYDELRIVGLVETDWPMRGNRNIFYPRGLLAQLGWPSESTQLAASRAAFRDLLRLPRERVSVSAPSLDDDALVTPSTFTEELEVVGLAVERPPVSPRARMFVHEALAFDPVAQVVEGDAADWLRIRLAASGPADRFGGAAGPQAVETFAVSHVEQYLVCPFKYFAGKVLKIDEEREEETGMTATERGQFLHDLLMEFFRRWQEGGSGAITPENVERATSEFRALVRERLPSLSPMDRALEEARLLGSAVAPGLADRLFAFELERDVPVVERLLEHRLEGDFLFAAGERQRTVRIRAQADRIDLLADGSLRIIDYKLGRAPKPSRALQLPIYGVCASQHLEGHGGRSWRVGEAGYVAFGEPDVFRPLASRGDIEAALTAGQQRLLDAVEGIERGAFPPNPAEPYLCNFCSFASVCRKDYVGDE